MGCCEDPSPGQQAGSTHHTGMLSCYQSVLISEKNPGVRYTRTHCKRNPVYFNTNIYTISMVALQELQ